MTSWLEYTTRLFHTKKMICSLEESAKNAESQSQCRFWVVKFEKLQKIMQFMIGTDSNFKLIQNNIPSSRTISKMFDILS